MTWRSPSLVAFVNRATGGVFSEIPGIGKWTAQYVAMRALGEPDAFPSGNLGLLRAMALKDSRELINTQGLEAVACVRGDVSLENREPACRIRKWTGRFEYREGHPGGVFLPASTFHWLYNRKALPLPPMTKRQTARVESTSFTVEISFYSSVLINALVLLPSSLSREWRVRLRDHRR
jgi:hypothetical protein